MVEYFFSNNIILLQFKFTSCNVNFLINIVTYNMTNNPQEKRIWAKNKREEER